MFEKLIVMDKALIDKVTFNHEQQMLHIKFKGEKGGYGESGENALNTLKQLQANNVPVIILKKGGVKHEA